MRQERRVGDELITEAEPLIKNLSQKSEEPQSL
jgi:hypothetical protein